MHGTTDACAESLHYGIKARRPSAQRGENALSIPSHVILPADMKEQVDALGVHHVGAGEESNV
jgi:hypothetical protein